MEWKTKKSCTRNDLESLQEHLSHAASLVGKTGHTFLRKLFALQHRTRTPHYSTHLSAGALGQTWHGSGAFCRAEMTSNSFPRPQLDIALIQMHYLWL